MKKTIITCDHCGKELNNRTAYVDLKIDNFDKYMEVDLCEDCFVELSKLVDKFVNKKS
jgi:hypothetical protein